MTLSISDIIGICILWLLVGLIAGYLMGGSFAVVVIPKFTY